MQKGKKRFMSMLQKYQNMKTFTQEDYHKLDINKKFTCANKSFYLNRGRILLLALFLLAFLLYTQTNLFNDSKCMIDMPSDASKWFREPESCKMCESVRKIAKISNISGEQFNTNYAKPAKPVVIVDGAKFWPAVQQFNFDFFKKLYLHSNESVEDVSCQFFPYKTEFQSLNEALNMNAKRANLSGGERPWYIGWSNCNDNAGQILRRYYEVPYFLPNTSENIALNWIFMGGPGQGAHMHVDNVQYPSWQAQLKGKKLWRLAPPPECLYKCQEMQVTVEPGEINTNRWYHQTFILPGEISITIGSEFD